MDDLTGLEEKQRILGDLKNLFGKKEDGDEMLKTKLSQAKSEFHKLKITYRQLHSKSQFWDFIESSQENWPSPSSIEQKIKANKGTFENVKDEIASTTEDLQELTHTTQSVQEQLEEKIHQFEEKLQGFQQKKTRLKELQHKHKEMYGDLKDGRLSPENSDEMLQHHKEQLEKAIQATAQCEVVMTNLKSQIDNLKCENEAIKARVKEARLVLQRKQESRQGKSEEKQKEVKRWERMYRFICDTGRIHNPKIEGNCISMEIKPLTESCSNLELQVLYTEGANHSLVMDDIKVNVNTLVLDEVKAQFIGTNDVGFLLQEIMQRFDSHAPLLGEIEDLRHRYAIDWIDEEGILRLMLSDDGHIVCTLAIEKGYPATGGVSLKAVSGVNQDNPLETLQPPTTNPSITDWIKYLYEQLGEKH